MGSLSFLALEDSGQFVRRRTWNFKTHPSRVPLVRSCGHRRTASVIAVTGGRVLALHGRTLRQLIDAEPAVAGQLLLRIGAVMAQRLAKGTRQTDDDAAEDDS